MPTTVTDTRTNARRVLGGRQRGAWPSRVAPGLAKKTLWIHVYCPTDESLDVGIVDACNCVDRVWFATAAARVVRPADGARDAIKNDASFESDVASEDEPADGYPPYIYDDSTHSPELSAKYLVYSSSDLVLHIYL